MRRAQLELIHAGFHPENAPATGEWRHLQGCFSAGDRRISCGKCRRSFPYPSHRFLRRVASLGPGSEERAMDGPGCVLVVDGDHESRAALSEVLERAGYLTQPARTGEEALEAAARQRPALVIMETHLPGASGYEICGEFRERYGDDLPIIFVSAARTEETDSVAGLLLGADDYLAKPIRFDHLLARVRRLVSRSTAVAGPVASRLT